MTIYNRTTRSEIRFAKITATGPDKAITLGHLEEFVAAAKAEKIPSDTRIEGPGPGLFEGPQFFSFLQAQAVISQDV